MQHYYRAVFKLGSWRAQVYTYDETETKIIIVYESIESFDRKGDAIDAASDWAEDNNIEVELG